MDNDLINKKAIHRRIKEEGLFMSSKSFPELFNKEVEALLKRSMKRTSANGRRIVDERDI